MSKGRILFYYKLVRDYGFAPNPFWGYCTLACCKPYIRNKASVGDWVIGVASSSGAYKNRIIYAMYITEKIDYETYWRDRRFENKKPRYDKGLENCYGDNIYHKEAGEWRQEDSHHSYGNNLENIKNKSRDLKSTSVLVSDQYWYFGEQAISINAMHDYLFSIKRGYGVVDDNMEIERIVAILEQYPRGNNGMPLKLNTKKTFVRYTMGI